MTPIRMKAVTAHRHVDRRYLTMDPFSALDKAICAGHTLHVGRQMISVWVAVAALAGACTSSGGSSPPTEVNPAASLPAGSLGSTVPTEFTVALATPDNAIRAFTSPEEAALFAAQAHRADLRNARVTRMVAIYADDTTVDLRVEVTADEFCHWYGVGGQVQQGALEWRAIPAGPCRE